MEKVQITHKAGVGRVVKGMARPAEPHALNKKSGESDRKDPQPTSNN